MENIKYGDKVTHPLHGRGKVGNVYPDIPLVTVYFEDDADSKRFGTDVHPVSLTKFVPVLFEVRIEWLRGAVTLSGPLDAAGVKRYLAGLELEDMRACRTERLS